MTTQLITNYFRLHNVNQFKESINETANSVYYVFAARHIPYTGGDGTVASVTNSVEETMTTPYEEMVFGKRVSANDVAVMIPRYVWTSNTQYSAYRSNEDLNDKQFFVYVDEGSSYSVFKCLDNNGNAYSTYAPSISETSPDDEYYATNDGYQWKFMYSITPTQFDKFATSDLIPVFANTQVVGNAVSGAIEVIGVTFKGSNYNTTLSGIFESDDVRIGGDSTLYYIANSASSANNFYTGSYVYLTAGTGAGQGRRIVDYYVIGGSKTIVINEPFTVNPVGGTEYEITPAVVIEGDGNYAEARAIVNTTSSNSISRIEIINRGSGYTWATATVTGNTGGISNNASLRVDRGPKGGHGSNPEYELVGTALGISVTFANNEVGTIPTENDYRTFGLLKDPLYANVVCTLTSPNGSFTVGELVTQNVSNASGYVTEWDTISTLSLTNVSGVFVTSQVVTGATSDAEGTVSTYQINGQAKNFNTFDQRYRYTFLPISGTFQQDEVVYQTDLQLANAIFHSNTSTNLYVTHVKGVLNTGNTLIGINSTATANLLFAYAPDLVKHSGEVVYVENETPITRSNSQSETIKLILQF
jgi:hypothetical protein